MPDFKNIALLSGRQCKQKQQSKGLMMMMVSLVMLLLLLGTTTRIINGQQSKPIKDEKDIPSSKFTEKGPIKTVKHQKDATKFQTTNQCKREVAITWTTNVDSSVYQTPYITNLMNSKTLTYGDRKYIIVPTFVRYIQVLNGESGAEYKESSNSHWPYTHSQLSSHSSVLLYDIDKDNVKDIILTTVNGEILFFNQNGELLRDYSMYIPGLLVDKFWYQGLENDKFDVSISLSGHESEKVLEKSLEREKVERELKTGKVDGPGVNKNVNNKNINKNVNNKNLKKKQVMNENVNNVNLNRKRDLKKKTRQQQDYQQQRDRRNKRNLKINNNNPNRRKLLQLSKAPATTEGHLSSEARASLSLIQQRVQTPLSLRPFLEEKYRGDVDGMHRHFVHHSTVRKNGKEYITVDSHVLSTPVIADIDNDGVEELIVSTSYYYDKEYYNQNMHELDADIDLSKYVAGGIAVFDLETRKLKWHVHLDMTTESVIQRAYIYGNPTIADIDHDGYLDVIVGTGLGWIYAYNHQGKLLEGFPILMGEIQGQVISEDVNGDGFLEICGVDFNSNLACFNGKGKEIWSTTLSGSAAQSPSVGDVDGDGILDLIVGTSTGHVWAVNGKTGKVLNHFPVLTGGAIYSPALLLDLSKNSTGSSVNNGLDIVLPSFDGYLYIINGKSGCIDKIDIGERSYSQVLADDITGNGKMDLIISTMNGNVICLSTESPYHPLKTTSYQMQYENGFKHRFNLYGIYFIERNFKDIVGSTFDLDFEIVDKRKLPKSDHLPKVYNVKIYYGSSNRVLFEQKYTEPGVYKVTLQSPKERMYDTVITIEMLNEFNQKYSDNFTVQFNISFLNIFKWMIVLPFVLSTLIVIYTLQYHQPKTSGKD